MGKKSNGGKKSKGKAGAAAASRAAAHQVVDATLAGAGAGAAPTAAANDGDAPVVHFSTAQAPTLAESAALIADRGIAAGDSVRVIEGEWAHQVGPVLSVDGDAAEVLVGGPRGRPVAFEFSNLRIA